MNASENFAQLNRSVVQILCKNRLNILLDVENKEIVEDNINS